MTVFLPGESNSRAGGPVDESVERQRKTSERVSEQARDHRPSDHVCGAQRKNERVGEKLSEKSESLFFRFGRCGPEAVFAKDEEKMQKNLQRFLTSD